MQRTTVIGRLPKMLDADWSAGARYQRIVAGDGLYRIREHQVYDQIIHTFVVAVQMYTYNLFVKH